MSILHETLKSYDSKSMDALLGLIKKKPGDRSSVEKMEFILETLSKTTAIPQYHGVDTLFLESLNMTAKKLDITNIDWHTMSEKEIVDVIYVAFQEQLIVKINKMSEKKRKALGEKLLEDLNSEDMGALKAGGALALALGAGEAAGFALFTGTAVGMKALGGVIGVTFNFGVYQAVMAALGAAVGPLGWIAVTGIVVLGGQKKWNSIKQNRLSFLILALIIEYKAREEHLANLAADENQIPTERSMDELGVLTAVPDTTYQALPESN